MANATQSAQSQRGGGGNRNQQQFAANPAAFNRLARLTRQKIGNIAYASGVSGLYTDLPAVGYHFRINVYYDLALGTAIASPTGRFLGGQYGGNTNRFPAPLGILKRLAYALNVSSPIWNTDGYGAYLMNLLSNDGMNPDIQVATGDVGYAQKELYDFGIVNTTDSTLAKPDAAVTGSKAYSMRANLTMNLTLGDAAAAGLVPCQDVRIRPQVFADWGTLTDLVSAGADFANAAPTGNLSVSADYFTIPDPSVKPDTQYLYQTKYDVLGIGGTGDLTYRPQIGGVIMLLAQSFWNNSKAMRAQDFDKFDVKLQQGLLMESVFPWQRVIDERKYYAKRLPDEAWVWDGRTGLGDPTMPSLRDRIASNQLTYLDFVASINATDSITGTSEVRNYLQQLVPLYTMMGS